jgi:hypothetical protein
VKWPKLSATKKLELVRIAVYSAGDTLTVGEALAFIGSLFSEDPIKRFDPAALPTLLNLVSVPRKARSARSRRGA